MEGTNLFGPRGMPNAADHSDGAVVGNREAARARSPCESAEAQWP